MVAATTIIKQLPWTMDNEHMSKIGDADTAQIGNTDPAGGQVGSTNKERPPVVEAEESKDVKSEELMDESRDTTHRTSTRLVRFQLFETKAVHRSHFS